MGITPYTPAVFSTPAVNPAVGGAGVPYPYVSNSQFGYAPTAMDTSQLVIDGSPLDQATSLAGVLADASAWADRICMGTDASAKGASLCASLTIESTSVRPVNGWLRLPCSYKPIVQVNGVDVGPAMGMLSSVGAAVASQIQVGVRTVYVPLIPFSNRAGTVGVFGTPYPQSGQVVVVWSYVNGYPHTELAEDVEEGAQTVVVQPTDGASGVLGIVPGQTQMRIVDGPRTETFVVQSVSGTTLTTVSPLVNAHEAPTAPDFLPVTSLPQDVTRAVIFLATALIKTRGDNALVLQEMTEPKEVERATGDEYEDVRIALHLLNPFRVRMKSRR